MFGEVRKCFKGDPTYFFMPVWPGGPPLLEASIAAACVPSVVKMPPRSDKAAADSGVDANRGGGGGARLFQPLPVFIPRSHLGLPHLSAL